MAVSADDEAQRDDDLGNFRACSEKCRSVPHAIEEPVGRGQRVAYSVREHRLAVYGSQGAFYLRSSRVRCGHLWQEHHQPLHTFPLATGGDVGMQEVSLQGSRSGSHNEVHVTTWSCSVMPLGPRFDSVTPSKRTDFWPRSSWESSVRTCGSIVCAS